MSRIPILLLLATFLLPSVSRAQSDWLVVGDQDNPESLAVWEHLQATLALEDTQWLTYDFPEGDQLDRTAWEDTIRPELAAAIAERQQQRSIQRIVVVKGVPLAVGAWNDERETEPWQTFYEAALQGRVDRYNQALEALTATVDLAYQPLEPSATSEQFRDHFDKVAGEVQQKQVELLSDAQATARNLLQSTVQEIAGLGPFLSSLRRDSTSNPRAASQFEFLRGRTETLSTVALLIERIPPTFDRESLAVSVLEQSGGLLSVIGWLKQQLLVVQENQSVASLDSELAVILWDDYRRLGNIPNLNHPSFQDSPLQTRYTTFSVRRVDGPSVSIAKELVDRYAQLSELSAADDYRLTGNVYLDLRGIQQGDSRTVRFERWLASVGQQLEQETGLEVTTEETPQLFKEGACPETVLYLGWYSLGRSVDSFTFRPGAIAYHMVPEDALGIHTEDDSGWCTYFLKNGATNVIGSVSEIEPVDFQVDQGPLQIHLPVLSSGMIIFGL